MARPLAFPKKQRPPEQRRTPPAGPVPCRTSPQGIRLFLGGAATVKPIRLHRFYDETLRSSDPPYDQVVVLDDDQRAWDARQFAAFTPRRTPFTQPELLLSVTDCYDDRSVVVSGLSFGVGRSDSFP